MLTGRHRKSRMSALSAEDSITLRTKAVAAARGMAGRPDMRVEGLRPSASALEPMRNGGAAQTGLNHKDVRKVPWTPMRGEAHREGARRGRSGTAGTLVQSVAEQMTRAKTRSNPRRNLFGR